MSTSATTGSRRQGYNFTTENSQAQTEARQILRRIAFRPAIFGNQGKDIEDLLPAQYREDRGGEINKTMPPLPSNEDEGTIQCVDESDSDNSETGEIDDTNSDYDLPQWDELEVDSWGSADLPSEDYESPFRAVLDSAGRQMDSATAFAYKRCLMNDQGLCHFLTHVVHSASSEELRIAKACYTRVLAAFARHENFVYQDDGSITMVNKTVCASFSPCVFLGISPPSGAQHPEPLLVGLLIYVLRAQGPASAALKSFSVSGRCHIHVDELLGPSDQRVSAQDIDSPGLYVINPLPRLAYVGMSHSLGLKHRTKAYEALEGGSRKLKVAKDAVANFPVNAWALMWHGAHLDGDKEAVVPASAVYAAESLFIAITGSWETTLEEVTKYCTSARLEERSEGPIVGLNTRLFDRNGAFLCQSAINCAGALQVVDFLIKQHLRRSPLPEWRDNGSDDSQEAAQFYRRQLVGIFPPTTPMSTIYRHIQLRTPITRRAMKAHPQSAKLTGFYLPGKNGVDLVKRTWKPDLW